MTFLFGRAKFADPASWWMDANAFRGDHGQLSFRVGGLLVDELTKVYISGEKENLGLQRLSPPSLFVICS